MVSRRVVLLVMLASLVTQPAFSQADLSGMWRPLARNQDGSGMDGDYAGLPLNEAGRWRAQSWAPENFDVPELVCRPHAWDYSFDGAGQLRFTTDIEDSTQRLVAVRGRVWMREQEQVIWMDGRQRPPDYVRYSWSGFSTGEWDGDVLVQTSTHLKEAYMRRWGPMRSDQSTVRIRYKRIGEYLRVTVIVYDPLYFAEPYIRTSLYFINDPKLVMPPYPCEEATETVIEPGSAPSYLPGRNLLPGQDPEVTDAFGTAYEPRLGGPETMYPEYIAKMKTLPRPPKAQGIGERGQ